MTYIKRVQYGEVARYEIVEDIVQTALDILAPYFISFQHPSNSRIQSKWTVYMRLPNELQARYKGTRPADSHWPQVIKDLLDYPWTENNPYALHFSEYDRDSQIISQVTIRVGAHYLSVMSISSDQYRTYHSILPLSSTIKNTYARTYYARDKMNQRPIRHPLEEGVVWLQDLMTRFSSTEGLTIRYWQDHMSHSVVRDLETFRMRALHFLSLGQPGKAFYRLTSKDGSEEFQFHITIDELGHYSLIYEGHNKSSHLSRTIQWIGP